ncbi:hypothetical protein [Acinetobacter bereziniae]|uniref:hypothetical protein n=1 Tax=Acinetobacter bereziniae TaxID=106648 RepID=UPI0021E3AF03|nr:hypothetical protein [Acinetobacter bereziniae]MCV2444228.1 hypothetical protein [Acinetobacter bereziniae]
MRKKLLFVLLIIAFTSIQFSFANVKYVHEKDKRQCSFIDNNQKILLAGVDEKTYFFFPCNKIISTYDVKFSQGTYLISELLLSTTPQTDQRYIRTIKNINNKFYDDKKLSYLLSTCVPLTKNSNQNLVKYLVNKKNDLKRICNIDDGFISINQKVFLYDKLGNDFKMRTSYLVKNDRVKVIDYSFKKNELWLYINYKNSVKKWISSKSINL